MSEPSPPTVRESADALGIRLARIGAAAVTLRGLTADLRASSSREALFTLLDGLERDLALASRQLLVTRQAARDHLDQVAGAAELRGGLRSRCGGLPRWPPHGARPRWTYASGGARLPRGPRRGPGRRRGDPRLAAGALRIDGATPGAQTGSSVAGAGDVNGDGHADIVIEGRRRAVTDAFGWSVDGAGDVDGDGLDDVVIAAPGNPGFEERVQRGAAYVVYGRRLGGTVRARRLGHRGFRIASADPGGLRSVAGAGDVDGDVNGDGLPDLIVGAPQGNRTPFNTAGGGAFVVFGRHSPRDVDLRAPGTQGIELRGSGSDWAGFAVASAGRIGGDRFGDVALLVRGSLAVVFGRRSAGTVRLDRLGPAAGYLIDGTVEPNQWYSDSASGGFITAAAVGGDADGDGTDDVLAGVRMADHNDRPDSGSAYLFFAGGP